MVKSPKDVIKKSYLKEKLVDTEFSNFKESFSKFQEDTKHDESEEYNKNVLIEFLNAIGYREYNVNTKDRIDLAIYNKDGVPEVIIESKKPNKKSEMISIDNLNKKAFHEAMLYFLREKHKENNFDIRHVIITNNIEWFIFDASEFNKIAINRLVEKLYIDKEIKPNLFSDKNPEFYKYLEELLKDSELLNNIDYSRFYLKDKQTNTQLKNIYKLLSPRHLLKQYVESDSNTLNTKFYDELLYILGLEETSGNKKLIQRVSKSKRSDGSLMENTIRKLETETECKNRDDELGLFEIALGLNITWLNRVLFLKLLEAKLVGIHNGDYPNFLSFETVREFDNLNTLFFEVLAIDIPDRRAIFIDDFKDIPYLNSALFETTDLECDYLRISNLKDNAKIKVLSTSVLGYHRNDELNTLEYLLKFLSAYDFATDANAEFKNEHTLINASVLGLIFEKLNGYKDGSFYTPSFITMYMTRQTIRQSVVAKFNEGFMEDKLSFDTFGEVKNYCDANFFKKDFLERTNIILDSITIVDPAVGSGHFLVSALNELLVIKSELKLLKGLGSYNISNENDELYVEDKEGIFFEYKLGTSGKIDPESQNVQTILFHEKQKIIENQLFGVDINPNSAQITRLRLWIELLKHSYYNENGAFVTMPNIDINIKAGNSLISRYSLYGEIDIPNIKHDIKRYKQIIKEYKEGNFSVTKDEIREVIENLKEKFKLSLKAEWHEIKKQSELLGEYIRDYGFHELDDELALLAVKEGYRPQGTLFGDDETISKSKTKKREQLLKKLTDISQKIDDKLNGKIYEDAFEWRFEFPEVLDEEGNFVGFDVVIGNPPYGASLEKCVKKYYKELYANVHMRTIDTFNYFVSMSSSLLASNAQLSFIIPNNFLYQNEYEKTRALLLEEYKFQVAINLGDDVFEDASVPTCIIGYANKIEKDYSFNYCDIRNEEDKVKVFEALDFEDYNKKSILSIPSYTFGINPVTVQLMQKVKEKSYLIDDIALEVASGISTGGDKIFRISEDIIYENGLESELLKRVLVGREINRYKINDTYHALIYTKRDTELRDYPNILEYLKPFENKLMQRSESKKGILPWYSLNRHRYSELFTEDKILLRQTADSVIAVFDNEKYFAIDSLLIFKINPKFNIDYKYTTTILNAKLTTFIYKNYTGEEGRQFAQVKPKNIRKLFIPKLDDVGQQPFITLADQIITLKKQNQDTKELEAQIDQMVYALYGLSEEEVALVEGRV